MSSPNSRVVPRRFAASRHPCTPYLAALAAALTLAPLPVRADICKYVDREGGVLFSNVAPGGSWKRLSCTSSDDGSLVRKAAPAGSGNAGSGAPRTATTPPAFPRIDAETQKGRDDVRRRVLGDELAAEEKLLTESRATYADGAPVPLPEERTNAEKYRERISRLRQAVALHERNVEALKKELAGTR